MTADSPDLEAVRRLLLAPDEEDAAVRAEAWRCVERRFQPTPRPRPRRALRMPRLVAVGAAVAAAAVGVPMLLAGDDGPGGALAPAPAAAALLQEAARQLGDDHPLAPGEARVVHVTARQLVVARADDGRVLGYVLPRRWEHRYAADGRWLSRELPDGAPQFASADARAAYEGAFGPYAAAPPKPALVRSADPSAPNPDLLGLSVRQVLGLPTDPGALRERLRQLAGALPSDVSRDVPAMATRLLVMAPTPPAVRAALMELIAGVPGVHVVGEECVGDRRGTTLALPADEARHAREQIVVDKQSGELLASRTILTAPVPWVPGSHAGMVFAVQAYGSAIVDGLDAPARFDVPTVAGPEPPAGTR